MGICACGLYQGYASSANASVRLISENHWLTCEVETLDVHYLSNTELFIYNLFIAYTTLAVRYRDIVLYDYPKTVFSHDAEMDIV